MISTPAGLPPGFFIHACGLVVLIPMQKRCVPGAAQQPRAARSATPRVVRCRPGTAASSVRCKLGACGGPGPAVHHDVLRTSRCTASGTQWSKQVI